MGANFCCEQNSSDSVLSLSIYGNKNQEKGTTRNVGALKVDEKCFKEVNGTFIYTGQQTDKRFSKRTFAKPVSLMDMLKKPNCSERTNYTDEEIREQGSP